MTTHRRYIFDLPWTGDDQAWKRSELLLKRQCERHWWFNEPRVEGEPERLTFSVTVSARDQWWCHRRAMTLAEGIFTRLGVTSSLIPVPMWETLAPHTNRGRFRTPRD